MVTPFNKPAPLEEGKMSPKRILEDFSLNVVNPHFSVATPYSSS